MLSRHLARALIASRRSIGAFFRYLFMCIVYYPSHLLGSMSLLDEATAIPECINHIQKILCDVFLSIRLWVVLAYFNGNIICHLDVCCLLNSRTNDAMGELVESPQNSKHLAISQTVSSTCIRSTQLVLNKFIYNHTLRHYKIHYNPRGL